VLCLWSDQSEFMVVFMAVNLWIGPGFMLGLVGNF
jgi:integral membrane sensor domain MASE1